MLGKISSRRVEFTLNAALSKSPASLEKSQSLALSDSPSVPLFKDNLRFSKKIHARSADDQSKLRQNTSQTSKAIRRATPAVKATSNDQVVNAVVLLNRFFMQSSYSGEKSIAIKLSWKFAFKQCERALREKFYIFIIYFIAQYSRRTYDIAALQKLIRWQRWRVEPGGMDAFYN